MGDAGWVKTKEGAPKDDAGARQRKVGKRGDLAVRNGLKACISRFIPLYEYLLHYLLLVARRAAQVITKFGPGRKDIVWNERRSRMFESRQKLFNLEASFANRLRRNYRCAGEAQPLQFRETVRP